MFRPLDTAIFRQNLTLNLNETRPCNSKFGSLDFRAVPASNTAKELNLNLNQAVATTVDLIDVSIPLERQGYGIIPCHIFHYILHCFYLLQLLS